MYRWRKFASSQWLLRHEMSLQGQTNSGLSVIQFPNRKHLRLEVASSSRAVMRSLCVQFGGEVERLPRNWRRQFAETAHLRPLRIGTRLLLHSTRKDDRAKARAVRQLIIPAAGAFGTGAHATTAMCLRLLEQISRDWANGWSMLDAGTGSGILALTAKLFGADVVIAIDNDKRALAIAQSNARLNRIDGVRFEIADATKYGTRRKFDVIVANLFSELLMKMIPNLKLCLKAQGFLVVSGILREQEREVVRSLHNSNLAIHETRRRGKWIAILARGRQKAG
jgi:ribosomal protein L11 methyltransferase